MMGPGVLARFVPNSDPRKEVALVVVPLVAPLSLLLLLLEAGGTVPGGAGAVVCCCPGPPPTPTPGLRMGR